MIVRVVLMRFVAGSLLVAAPALCGKALAAECKPLAMYTSVDLVPGTDRRAELIPVKIAGVPKLMLLDTGGAITEITPDAVDELGLRRRRGGFEQYNVAGLSTSEFTTAPFEIGRLKADKMAFVVALESFSDKQIAGTLGPDALRHYDVSVDFGTDKLDLLSPDHCEGQVVYWPAAAVATIPIRVLDSGHIVLPVTLDGHQLTAILDTGAYNTTLKVVAAESFFGLKPGDADTPKEGELSGREGAFTYRHKFKSLELNGITVSNVDVVVIPDQLGHKLANRPEIGTRLANPGRGDTSPDMLLGMDVLRHLHIYIAYKEEKLYVTAAGAPTKPAGETPEGQ